MFRIAHFRVLHHKALHDPCHSVLCPKVSPIVMFTIWPGTQAFEAELSKSVNLMTAPQGTVWKAMWRKHGRVFLAAGLLKLVHDCVMFLGPFVLQQLLIFLEKGGTACKM